MTFQRNCRSLLDNNVAVHKALIIALNSLEHEVYLSALITFFHFSLKFHFISNLSVVSGSSCNNHLYCNLTTLQSKVKKHRADILTAHNTGEGKAVPVHAMMAHGGWKVQLQSFLTSGLDKGECLDSYPGCLTAGKRTPVSTEQETTWASDTL